MNIYSNYSVNFMSGKNTLKTQMTKKATNVVKKNEVKNSNAFYDDINKFLDRKCSKEDYLKTLVKKVNNNEYANVIQNNHLERKYVNDMLTTIDLSRYVKDIPDEYLTSKMLKLLESKK